MNIVKFLKGCFPLNVNRSERGVRLVVGVALLGLSFSDAVTPTQEFWLVLLGWLGVLSGIIGHCPVYGLFGKSSLKNDDDKE